MPFFHLLSSFRGMLHAHMLVALDKESKLDTPEKVDRVVQVNCQDKNQ